MAFIYHIGEDGLCILTDVIICMIGSTCDGRLSPKLKPMIEIEDEKERDVIGQYGLYLATNGLREQVIYCLKYSNKSYSYQHSNFIDFRFRYSE